MYEIQVRFRFITPVLGSLPSNTRLFTDYVLSKAPVESNRQEEEIQYVEANKVAKPDVSIFTRDRDGNLCLRDYQIKGFIKGVGDELRKRHRSSEKSGWENWKSKVNLNLHVYPRFITLDKKEPDEYNERPLRAETMQGPRVALVSSEQVNEGAELSFGIIVRGLIPYNQLIEVLDEGEFYGLGQWRNAGWGRFDYEVLKQSGDIKTTKKTPEKKKVEKPSTDPLDLAYDE